MLESANFGWTTGENCVKFKYKYHSRYIEDQRMLESTGLVEKNAVTAFLDKYYEEHPLDNSPEGILARYSGMTVA